MDACLALETVQHNVLLIKELAFNWSHLHGDIFDENQLNLQSTFQQTLQKHQYILFSMGLLIKIKFAFLEIFNQPLMKN